MAAVDGGFDLAQPSRRRGHDLHDAARAGRRSERRPIGTFLARNREQEIGVKIAPARRTQNGLPLGARVVQPITVGRG
jgi:hypothetical protein